MEEADILGDTIGVLVSGKLRAFGSAIYLKNTFGSGYHITCLCSEDRAPAVTEDRLQGSKKPLVSTLCAAADIHVCAMRRPPREYLEASTCCTF